MDEKTHAKVSWADFEEEPFLVIQCQLTLESDIDEACCFGGAAGYGTC